MSHTCGTMSYMDSTRDPRTIVIIPCGGAKADRATTAVRLYTGQMFTHTLRAARAITTDANIYILSALHGLITLDTIVAPYDTRMGNTGCVTADQVARQATAHDIANRDDVYTLLPRAYREVASAALQSIYVYPQDVYEDLAGIGEQRHVNAVVTAA